MNGAQLLLVLGGFFCGVVLESLFAPTILFIVLLVGVAFIEAVYWRRFGSLLSLAVSLCLLLAVVGIARTQWYEAQFDDTALAGQVGEQVTLVGTVVTEPDERANFTQLYVQTKTEKVLVRADRFADVAYGDRVQVSGKLTTPEVFETDTGRVFDYPKYLQVRGVQYVMGFVSIEVLDTGQGNPLLAFLYTAKQHFVSQLERVLPSPAVDLGVGLLLGVKQALGDELETAFRQTGIIHIVVLSGYNVMLVVGFFWWLSSWVLPLRGRIIFGLIGITLFALLVGLSATVVRASIMATVLLVGKWLGRTYDVLRALLFAAAMMVLINPYILLYDIGFQLSFMATLGLVLVLPQFESTLATDTRALKLRDLFLATVVTQIFVLPLLMYYIGEVSLVSVVVNMLVLPMVPIAMMATFVVGLLSLVSITLGSPLGMLAQLPLQYIIVVAQWFASLPFAAVVIPEISVWVLLGMYGVLGVGYWAWLAWKHNESNEVDVFADWEIVEESEHKAGSEAAASDPAKVPVFFR